MKVKQITIVLLFTIIIFSGLAVAKGNEGDMIDKWYTEDKRSVVKIYKKDNLYYGKIVWLKNPEYSDGTYVRDVNNPDQSKRDRKVLGINILKGFEYKGDNTWEDGTIYDPESGKTYSCKIKLKDNKLNVRGYVGVSLFGRTTVWTRKKKSNKNN